MLGAARASMVTYIVPAVGLLLGVVFLNEKLDTYIILGAGLIFVAIGIVNIRFGQKPKAKIEDIEAKPAAQPEISISQIQKKGRRLISPFLYGGFSGSYCWFAQPVA